MKEQEEVNGEGTDKEEEDGEMKIAKEGRSKVENTKREEKTRKM